MKSIGIKNLRSLRDTKQMEIKPINILVGSNSSGKSTFLRLFPLMKQSLRNKINGPILWAGDDDDYVDFGSFSEAVNNNSKEKIIKFRFTFDMKLNTSYDLLFIYNFLPYASNGRDYSFDVDISLSQYKDIELDYISEVGIKFLTYNIILRFNDKKCIDSIEINGNKHTIAEDNQSNKFYGRSFIGSENPLFTVDLYGLQITSLKELSKIINPTVTRDSEIFDERREVLEYLFCKNILNEELENQPENQVEELRKYDDKKYSTLQINELLLMYKISSIYSNISNYLSQYFRNVYYIAPVRATAERYYRLRNTAVNEVDCRGKNLPIFLNSLKDNQFREFQKWTKNNLGFSVEKSLSEGHVSLKIRKGDSQALVNISDAGFGYSQILPIITQLWYITLGNSKQSRRHNIPITIAIEQPELHLHPALQAKLVDVMVKVMKSSEKGRKINFVIETHSETIINRFGNLIYKKKVENDKIAIFIFNKDGGDKDTEIKFGKYDEEGYLENWPVGFFDPEEVS